MTENEIKDVSNLEPLKKYGMRVTILDPDKKFIESPKFGIDAVTK